MITKLLAHSIFILGIIGLCGCAGMASRRTTAQYLDDRAIAANVKTRMLLDSSLENGSSVKVISFLDHVLLSGYVDNESQKQLAGDIAKNVSGVGWVKNSIIVKDSIPDTRAAKNQPITEAAGAQRRIDRPEVEVTVPKIPGTNIISGSVPARKSLLEPNAVVADEFHMEAVRSGADMTALNNYLARQLRSEFRGDPALSAATKDLHVGVSNGKMVITGVVGSEAEKKVIMDKVRDLRFENKMTVK